MFDFYILLIKHQSQPKRYYNHFRIPISHLSLSFTHPLQRRFQNLNEWLLFFYLIMLPYNWPHWNKDSGLILIDYEIEIHLTYLS